MDLLAIQKALDELAASLEPAVLEYSLAFIFLLYAVDRFGGAVFRSERKKSDLKWVKDQKKFVGASDEIYETSNKMGIFALLLVVAKPFLIAGSVYFEQPLIDTLGVGLLGSVILYLYFTGMSKFFRREKKGQAIKVPFKVKETWLQLRLHQVGLSYDHLRVALTIAVIHTVTRTTIIYDLV